MISLPPKKKQLLISQVSGKPTGWMSLVCLGGNGWSFRQLKVVERSCERIAQLTSGCFWGHGFFVGSTCQLLMKLGCVEIPGIKCTYAYLQTIFGRFFGDWTTRPKTDLPSPKTQWTNYIYIYLVLNLHGGGDVSWQTWLKSPHIADTTTWALKLKKQRNPKLLMSPPAYFYRERIPGQKSGCLRKEKKFPSEKLCDVEERKSELWTQKNGLTLDFIKCPKKILPFCSLKQKARIWTNKIAFPKKGQVSSSINFKMDQFLFQGSQKIMGHPTTPWSIRLICQSSTRPNHEMTWPIKGICDA